LDDVSQAELDALDTLVDSPGWELVKQRLQEEIGRMQRELEREIPEARTHRIRGGLTALRVALELPANMRAELAEQLKNGTKKE
jgi:hypothetical protein